MLIGVCRPAFVRLSDGLVISPVIEVANRPTSQLHTVFRDWLKGDMILECNLTLRRVRNVDTATMVITFNTLGSKFFVIFQYVDILYNVITFRSVGYIYFGNNIYIHTHIFLIFC